VTPEEVRALALSLPETEERETWNQPTFRVDGKIFAWLGKARRPAGIKISKEEREELIASDPGKFFVIPEDIKASSMRIRLEDIGADEMLELLTDAWRAMAPKDLVERFDRGHGRDV
jgi:hypothetical protein